MNGITPISNRRIRNAACRRRSTLRLYRCKVAWADLMEQIPRCKVAWADSVDQIPRCEGARADLMDPIIEVVPTGEGALDKALNDWIDQYTGEYKDKGYLLKWNDGELVQEKIPEEGVDCEWNDDHTECTILTPEGLLWFSDQVVTEGNDFDGKTVILDKKEDNDYWNLGDIEW